jgi:hypothetical protein
MILMILNGEPALRIGDEARARLREWLCYGLLCLLAGSIGLAGWLAYQFSIPWSMTTWTAVGSIEQFPPRSQPYRVYAEQLPRYEEPYRLYRNYTLFYLVNDGDALFAVDFRTHRATGPECLVTWDAQKFYIDPCLGTRYSIYGDYMFYGPPPLRGLDRYPVRVTSEGLIEAQLDHPQPGRTPDQVEERCRTRHSGPRFITRSLNPWHWIPFECDFRAVATLEQAD